MSKPFFKNNLFILAALLTLLISSCNKDLSRTSSTASTNANTLSTSTIAVAVDSATGDSIYVIQPCARGFFRDSISLSSLPAAAINYLDSNYTGFVFSKAYVIKDSAGAVGGYVAIIQFNGKPVAILFTTSGAFVQVLEQREAGDLNGPGWHNGGRYCDRNGKQGDTVALSSLPAAIASYFSANYSADTLLRAYKNIDSSYLVISRNNGIYATLFDSAGHFIKRIQLSPPQPVPPVSIVSVAQDSIPATSLSYLTSSYPNYVFEKAFSVSNNGTLQGYIVVIDANSSKYAVYFDAAGNYLSVRIIW